MNSPPPAAITGLHLGEFIPPLIATVAYLYLYSRPARRLARERRPVATWASRECPQSRRAWCERRALELGTRVGC
jgi:hypothetical protein